MSEKEKKTQKLKNYFEKRDDTIMAFIFGSQAGEGAHHGSDWDIAVYFKPILARVEWEEHNREYPAENEIWKDCTVMLETDNIDIVVLNRAPVDIADAAIAGTPLVIKDRKLFIEFMLIVGKAAEDFHAFSKDYFDIYMRSASLSEQDADRLRNIIEFISTQKILYENFRKLTKEVYDNDLIMRGAVERWLENMTNAVIDISKIVLASSKIPSPHGYVNTVERAASLLKLPEETANKFITWVKVRNELAHEYLDIKWKKISDFIDNSEPRLEGLTNAVINFLAESQK